ncbi:hypothetical protein [Photobacterium sp. GB-36]|uniref:hypothetical protein n=1 Tax=Photobacterium sp. GB-36 TaxID=2022108 RepID=UPI000D15E549|nr:hypothetical protein [Photobacterium sp. GB-36]PSV44606.1 hypothetical protein C9J46_08870 [Photobacterium sp. GB-36]
MSSRSERFKKRQQLRSNYAEKSHIKELANSEVSQQMLARQVDQEFIDNALLEKAPIYDLNVSEAEVKASLKMLDIDFNKEKYDVLFESSKDVLINQLLNPLNLSRADLENVDRNFEYNRDDYTKSPKSSGGEGVSFDTQRKKLKLQSTNEQGQIKDTYTGQYHDASEMDLDHVKSLKAFHESGAYMLSDVEKRQFAADPDNHEFTHNSLNRSKGEKDLKEFSETNEQADKRRTNAAHTRAEKAAEKYVPSNPVGKTVFVAKRGAVDGVKAGSQQGLQQALGALLSEFISATFIEVKDIFNNGFKGNALEMSWVDALISRLNNIKNKLLSKWKNVAQAFAAGALSGFLSSIITALLNMFVRTGKNMVRIIREGFMSLTKALKTLIFPPEGMTAKQAAHEATKILATGLVITGGIMAGEAIATALGTIPFAGTISMVLTGLLSGLGSLFVVFMLDKLDMFGVNEAERHEFIMGRLESRITVSIERSETIIKELGLSY